MNLQALLFVATLALTTTASTFTNPLKPKDGADPSLLYLNGNATHQGYYYLLNTASDGYIESVRATTLEGLKNGTTKNIWNPSHQANSSNYWAPEFHELNGTWYIYFTATIGKDPHSHKPYVAKGGRAPWDEYTLLAQLSPDWGIDGSLIHFPTHGHYFVWSCRPHGEPDTVQNDHLPDPQQICIAPLSEPGNIGKHGVISTPTYDWETVGAPVNEAPHALYHANKVYLTYSASSCGTNNYSLGLLTWDSQGDPIDARSWSKSKKPVLSSANGNYGTGHNGFFRSPDGTEIWNVFHAQDKPTTASCGNERYTMAERVYFNATGHNGQPKFEPAQRLSKVQTAPSGEGKKNARLATNHEPSQN